MFIESNNATGNKMTIEQQYQALADSMNISIYDVKAFVTSMVNSIEQDKMAEHFIKGSDDFQSQIVQAYAPVVVKKFNQFLSAYLTDSVARFTFELSVFNELKTR